MLLSSLLSAQAPIIFTNTFDVAPTLASTQTAGAWYPDRYPPTIFEQYNFSGENVLHVGIRIADAYWNRPLVNHNTFANTQGRKYDLSSGNGFNTAMIADLYVGADWNTKHRMATLWSTANDSTNATSFYNYFGFRNSTGSNPGFYVYGVNNIGAYTLVPFTITYGQWYSLKIELTDTAFVYSINGVVVLSDTTLNGTKYFNNLMLQAYNFADSTLATEVQSFEEYDVYWDNVGTITTTGLRSNPATVDLLTAANFRILAGSTITIGSGATITGDIGVSPGSTVTNSGTVDGSTHLSDAEAIQAQSDLTTAYNDAAGRAADTTVATELGGKTLGRGVYVSESGTFEITGNLTLTGTSDDIFIFKMASSLTTGVSSSMTLTGGVLASNIFWQVGSSATIGVEGDFKGNILALTAITHNTGSIVEGRSLARNSFVTVSGEALLPVELTSFTAIANRMNADLQWSTATEVNNFGFEVQRKSIDTWSKAGFIDGAGTTNAPKEYSFSDNNLSSGNYSYRLKQIDRDGKFSYSKSVEVTITEVPKEFALSQNYPNPFNPSTMINYQLPTSSNVTLTVYDAIGKVMTTLVNEVKEAGNYSVQFDASYLSSGVYFYTITAGNFTATKKLTLMK